jgi:hypothetical protein
LYAFFISLMRATCYILLHLITRIIFTEAYKFCEPLTLHSSPISHHFIPPGSKYSLHHPVLSIFILPSFRVRDQVSDPYKIAGKITVLIS